MKRKNEVIPKIIHYIWIGGEIPLKYLKTIIELGIRAKSSRFNVILWTDKAEHYTNALKNSVILDIAFPRHTNITVRLISELFYALDKNAFFLGTDPDYPYKKDEKNRLRHFFNCINREMVGFKNLGAAADLLRYAILLEEGGFYFDADTEFIFEKEAKLATSLCAHGALINASFELHRENQTRDLYISVTECANDIIAVIPDHPLMKKTLLYALESFTRLDKNQPNKSLTLMDEKRFPYHKKNAFFPCPRMKETILSTGPGALAYATVSYMKNIFKNEDLSNYKTLTNELRIEKANLLNIEGKKWIKIITKSDQNWMQGNKDKKAFDDSSLTLLYSRI